MTPYHKIAPRCRPAGGVPGCPHDGLGCPYGERCSIGSPDPAVRARALDADRFGPDFHCVKHELATTQPEDAE